MSEAVPPIGTLTDRVQLKRREMTGDATGGHGTSADGRAVEISHAVVLRFRIDIRPGDRILYRGRSLDVVSAADLNGRRAYLSCACSETSFTG
ncbi:MAG: phage head closure protein [Devosia sp.]